MNWRKKMRWHKWANIALSLTQSSMSSCALSLSPFAISIITTPVPWTFYFLFPLQLWTHNSRRFAVSFILCPRFRSLSLGLWCSLLCRWQRSLTLVHWHCKYYGRSCNCKWIPVARIFFTGCGSRKGKQAKREMCLSLSLLASAILFSSILFAFPKGWEKARLCLLLFLSSSGFTCIWLGSLLVCVFCVSLAIRNSLVDDQCVSVCVSLYVCVCVCVCATVTVSC